MEEQELDEILSKEEIMQLIVMYMQSNGPTSEDKITEVIEIASGIEISHALYHMALNGEINFTVLDSEFAYYPIKNKLPVAV